MKVCHVTTHILERGGGTEIAVRSIRQNYDIKSIGAGGALLYLRSFSVALKLLFSKYDIVHIHDMAGYGYTFVPKFMRKKTIYSCHGLWDTYFQGEKSLLANFLINAQKRIIKKSDVVVATSRFRVKEIKDKYGVDSIYIHNGVDVKKFKPSRAKKVYDFLWIGTNKEKGLDFAINFAKKKGGSILVVGIDGQDSDGVTFVKHVPHEEMPQIYAKCKTLINYSLISRYDFVVLEAMASGLDVIINKESAEELLPGKKMTQDVIFIPGKNGRKIAERLSWNTAIREYNKLYRRLAA